MSDLPPPPDVGFEEEKPWNQLDWSRIIADAVYVILILFVVVMVVRL